MDKLKKEAEIKHPFPHGNSRQVQRFPMRRRSTLIVNPYKELHLGLRILNFFNLSV